MRTRYSVLPLSDSSARSQGIPWLMFDAGDHTYWFGLREPVRTVATIETGKVLVGVAA